MLQGQREPWRSVAAAQHLPANRRPLRDLHRVQVDGLYGYRLHGGSDLVASAYPVERDRGAGSHSGIRWSNELHHAADPETSRIVEHRQFGPALARPVLPGE